MIVIEDIDILDDPALQVRLARTSLIPLVIAALLLVAWLGLGLPRESVDFLWILLFIGVYALSLFIHEGIHGALFKLFGGREAKVSFGMKPGMFYTTCPDIPFERNRFMAILLGPAVTLSAVFFLGGFLIGLPFMGTLLTLVHLSGCCGDLMMAHTVRQRPEAKFVQDTPCGVRLLCEGAIHAAEPRIGQRPLNELSSLTSLPELSEE